MSVADFLVAQNFHYEYFLCCLLYLTVVCFIMQQQYAEMKSKSVQIQLNSIYYTNYMFRPISGHPQVHNLCLTFILVMWSIW
jgi:hypothetical protein